MANKNFKARIGIEAPLIAADNGTTAITLTGANAAVAGTLSTGGDLTVGADLIVNGNEIRSNGGTLAISLSGANATVAGDLAVNGTGGAQADITTTASSASLFNTTATTVKLGEAATTVSVGAATGTTTVNNNLDVNGTVNIDGATLSTTQATFDLANSGTTTVNAFGAATTLTMGATTGTATIRNAETVLSGNLTLGNNTIKSSGGTAAITTSGDDVTVEGDLTVDGVLNTNDVTAATTLTIDSGANMSLVSGGTILIRTDQNDARIDLQPDGTGNIGLFADTVEIGDVNANATLTTNGSLGNLILTTGTGTLSNITIAAGSNGDISLTPNGTGEVNISRVDINAGAIDGTTIGAASAAAGTFTTATATTGNITTVNSTTVDTTNLEVTNIKALDGTAAATIADTTGVITVSTALNVDNLNLNGNTVSSTDTNGSITLDPNGTGDIVLTLADGGNLINSRNYVLGAIRNSTTEAAGNIWSLNQSASTQPFRGLTVDNSADTTKLPGFIGRSYSNTAGFRSRLVFERARGTAASPTAVQNGDFLGEVDVTGYTSTGWINDTLTAVPGFFGFNAAENWVSNTNLGTSFTLSLAPTATTIASGANLVPILTLTPQTATIRSDAFTFQNGKTGTTTVMTIDVSGNVAITGDLRVNGNDILSSGNTSQITMSSAGATLELRGNTIQLEDAAGTAIKGGKIDYSRVHGCFHKVANVTAAAANTVYEFDWYTDTTAHVGNQGVTVTSGNPTRVNIDTAGAYTATVEMQAANTDNADRFAYIWLAKNGTDLTETRITVKLQKENEQVITKLWLLENIAANDYIELRFAVDNISGISLNYEAAQASPFVMPAQPSATFTIVPVGA
jgi:hypothetical protein